MHIPRRSLIGSVALVLIVGSAAPWVSPPVAVAQESPGSCGKVLPMDAIDSALFGTGAAGLPSFVGAPLTAPTTLTGVAAGGATATATLGAGTVLLGAAAFLAAFSGTCRFLDWVSGDVNVIEAMTPPTVFTGPGEVTASEYERCSTVQPFLAGNQWGYGDMACMRLHLPAPGLTTYVDFRSNQSVARTFYYGDAEPKEDNPQVNIARVPGHPIYGDPASNRWINWFRPENSTLCNDGGDSCYYTQLADPLTPIFTLDGCTFDPTSQYGQGIGGACGLHPRTVVSAVRSEAPSRLRLVTFLNPLAAERGWARYVMTDVKCRNPVDNSSHWVRAVTTPYYEADMTRRMPMPSCVAGEIPQEIKSYRVPVNYDCSSGPGPNAYCGGLELDHVNSLARPIMKFAAPDSLVTSTGPAWNVCLGEGNACGAPIENLQTNVCTWGGHTVNATFCAPERQANSTQTLALTQPQMTEVATPAPHVVGQPQATTTPEGDPDPDPDPTTPPVTTVAPGPQSAPAGTDVNGETAPRPNTEEGGAECFPSGWGWLNPVTWVLKPVKCALVWAFVPSEEALANLQAAADSAKTKKPLSWVIQIFGMLANVSTGLPGAIEAGSDDCVTFLPTGNGMVPDDVELCPSAFGSLTWVRPAMGVLFWLGFAWWLARKLTAMVGEGGGLGTDAGDYGDQGVLFR